jgi:SAM-dependent MidA family methyltransferase
MMFSDPVPVEEFMRRALHEPGHGYYPRRIRGIGRHGDFTTAPMLGSSLARAIACWAARALRETGCRDLIEIGPGEGRLAANVRRHLPWMLRRSTRFHLVETSPALAALQKSALGRHARWHGTPAAALAACNGRAVVFSNELVDAFPARCFEKQPGGWREIAVALDPDGTARESLLPPAALPSSSVFDHDFPPGQRVEVHESCHRWLDGWLPLWKAGRMLTIDYGATVEKLYQRRPRGTLRAYLLHQRLEGLAVFGNPGRQDITADVNFSDLAAWCAPHAAGMELHTLGEFILRHADAAEPADPQLLDPHGAGGAFMALDVRCRA